MNNKPKKSFGSRKINAFDLLTLLFLSALLLTSALHLTDREEPASHTYAVLLIKREQSRGELTVGDAELYSSRAEIIGVSSGHILLLVEGRRTERGFLLGSSKYLFLSHPLTVRTEDGYVSGRIEKTFYPKISDE